MTQGAAVPRFNKLMWPTLKALGTLGNSGSVQEIDSTVGEKEGYTDEQRSVLHGRGAQTEMR